MEQEISCNVSILTEEMNKKLVYVARCEELGISDFGDTPEEAIKNLKIALNLFLEEEPSKKSKLIKEKPLMTTRIFF